MLWIKNAAERAATSAGEQFLAIIVLGQVVKISGLPWAAALSTAGGAAVVSILLSLTQFAYTLPYWADVIERGVKAFAAALLATLGGGVVNLMTVPWTDALDVAALAAFLAVVKALVSKNADMSGSWLPTPTAAKLAKVELGAGNSFHRAA